nr:hypothetical protein FTX54_16320 [Alkalicoccus halolimnae]
MAGYELRLISNLKGDKGDKGDQGVQGLPGPGAVPADDAVAGYVSTEGTSATQEALDARYGATLHATAHGVVGDGTTNDAAALEALLTKAATFGLGVVLREDSTVLVDSTVVVPSGTRLDLNGSTIKRGPTGSGGMLNLTGKTGVRIHSGALDGNKAAYAPATEWRHNIIIDDTHDVKLWDLRSDNSKGDGIYVGGAISHCTDVSLFNVTCDGNHRQGMSIIAVDGLVATSSRFINTAGTAPESGVDVEPNNPNQLIRNVRFIGCTMTGNAGHGYLEVLVEARTVYQGDVILTACNLDGNAVAGVRLTESQDFQMIGGSASRNLVGVRHDTRKLRNAKFTNVTMQGNGQHGVGFTAVYDELAFTACTFKENGATTTGDGLNIAPVGTSTALRFIGNFSGGGQQRNGVTLGANVSGAAFIANQYGVNTGTARSGTSVITLDLDAIGKRTVTGSRGGNAALTSLLTQMAGIGLITDSTTA